MLKKALDVSWMDQTNNACMYRGSTSGLVSSDRGSQLRLRVRASLADDHICSSVKNLDAFQIVQVQMYLVQNQLKTLVYVRSDSKCCTKGMGCETVSVEDCTINSSLGGSVRIELCVPICAVSSFFLTMLPRQNIFL